MDLSEGRCQKVNEEQKTQHGWQFKGWLRMNATWIEQKFHTQGHHNVSYRTTWRVPSLAYKTPETTMEEQERG